MKSAKLMVCFISALFWSCASDTCLNICSLIDKTVPYTCEKIRTDSGYTLQVSEIIPVECMEKCEVSWYDENNTLLVDPKNPSNLPDSIAEVTCWNLTTRSCLDKAYWKIDCHYNAILVISYKAVTGHKIVDGQNGNDGNNGINKENLHFLWLLCILVHPLLVY